MGSANGGGEDAASVSPSPSRARDNLAAVALGRTPSSRRSTISHSTRPRSESNSSTLSRIGSGKSTHVQLPTISSTNHHHNHHLHHSNSNEGVAGGSGESPASHFFTTVISAAQNAASSLAGMKSGGGGGGGAGNNGNSGANGHSRSLSDNVGYAGDDTNNDAGGEYDEKNDEHSRLNAVKIEPVRATISTLGKGELSFASLGLDEAEANGKQSTNTALENEDASYRDQLSIRSSSSSLALSHDYQHSQQQPQQQQQSQQPHAQHSSTPNNAATTPTSGVTVSRNNSRSDKRKSSGSQSEFTQGGTLAVPVMSRSKSRASSLITRHRRKRAQSLGGTSEADEGESKEDSHQITGFAYANKKRNKEFHRLFRSITPDDYLLDDFSCALSKEILIHGRLYVSEKHVCFNSNILGWVTNLVIAFDEIVTLEKKNTAGLFPNGITIQTLHARHSFASFVARDSALEFLTSIWKQSSPHQAREGGNGQSLPADTDSEGYEDDDDDDDENDISNDDEEDYDDDDNGDETDHDDSFNDSEGDSLGSFGSSEDDVEADAKKEDNGGSQSADKKGDDSHGNDGEEGGGGGDGGNWPFANLGPATHAPTESGHNPEADGEKLLQSEVVNAPLGVVANVLFGDDTTWLKKFITENQKNINLNELKGFKADSSGKKVRNYEYVKPLNGAVGPKQTRCICTETAETWDMEKAVVVVTSTQTPDVPSGSNFLTKTRMALCWAEDNQTKLTVSYWMDWSGKSWLKGAIERGSHDGQTTFAKELFKELNATLASGGKRKRSTSKSVSKKKGGAKKKRRNTTSQAEKSPEPAAAEPTSMLGSVVGAINYVPLSQVPLPVWGWLMSLTILYLIAFRPRAQPVATSGLDERMDRRFMQDEYEIWRWIDDRAAQNRASGDEKNKKNKQNSGGKKSSSSQHVSVKTLEEKYGKQELQESIRITEHRLKILKEKLDADKLV